MSGRGFDFDLIMELASGGIPPEKAAELEAGLDDDARRELASQRTALQALGRLPRPALSTPERRRLRAGVRAELGITEAAEAGTRPRPRKVRWARAFPALAAAAALVVVIGVARNDGREPPPEANTAPEAAPATAAAPPVPPSAQSGETAAATQATVAATATTAMPATTTQALAETPAAQADAMEAEQAMAAAAGLEEAADAARAADSLTAAAAGGGADAGTGGAPPAPPASFDLSSVELLESADDAALLASFLDEYAAGAPPFPFSELEAGAGRAGLECWEAVEAAESARVLFAGAGLIDGSEGEAYIIEEDGAAGVRLFNAPDCTNLNP